jgi:hypothetical protein
MDFQQFLTMLLLAVAVITVAMLYLRRITRQVVTELCQSDAGAEFWLRSADIMAYSGTLMLVLIFGNSSNACDWVEAIRYTLISTLAGLCLTVAFVSRNVWRTITTKTVNPS